jgi:hypothetical protein
LGMRRPDWRRGLYPGPAPGLGGILGPMLDDMRKYVRAGLDALASSGSDDLAATLKSRAESFADQMSSLAAGFLEWSGEARASLVREVKELVAAQVKEMGLASRREVEALRKRVERLEGAGRAKAGATRTRSASSASAPAPAKRAKSPIKSTRPRASSSSPRRAAGSGRR